jgi:hypothetical protein
MARLSNQRVFVSHILSPLISVIPVALIAGILIGATTCTAEELTSQPVSVTVNARDGSYELGTHGGQIVLTARAGAQVDHQWLRSSDYPRRQAAESGFNDELGSGHQMTVTCGGLDGKPDLTYVLQIYAISFPTAPSRSSCRTIPGKK